jgi:hypothetical protein
MPYKWMFILGFIIGALLFLFTMQCLEWAAERDTMTEYMMKNPTGAGRR